MITIIYYNYFLLLVSCGFIRAESRQVLSAQVPGITLFRVSGLGKWGRSPVQSNVRSFSFHLDSTRQAESPQGMETLIDK